MAVHWLRRSLTAYNSGSVTPSDAGGCWRIIVLSPTAILVSQTAHWGLLGKKSTCYAGYLIVKVQESSPTNAFWRIHQGYFEEFVVSLLVVRG